MLYVIKSLSPANIVEAEETADGTEEMLEVVRRFDEDYSDYGHTIEIEPQI